MCGLRILIRSSEALTYRSPPLSSMPPLAALIGRNRGVMLLDRLFRPRPAQAVGPSALCRAWSTRRGRRRSTPTSARPTRWRAASSSTPCTSSCCWTGCAGRATQAAETSQALFDTYVKRPGRRPARDGRRRPLGGQEDAQAGRGLLRPGQVLRGRASRPCRTTEPLEALLARTVYAERRGRPARRRLAAYVLAQRDAPGGPAAGRACWPARSTGGRHEPALVQARPAARARPRRRDADAGARRGRAGGDRQATWAWRACRR